MSDETIARLFNRLDDMVKEISAMRSVMSILEERLHHYVSDFSEMKGKLDEVSIRLNNVEDEISAFKWWVKGAYVALALSAGVVLWVLTRTGVLERVFG
jgi:hypothetical protein